MEQQNLVSIFFYQILTFYYIQVSQKERQKIKRTKSTKRYKTITEGIAPRDLELARQAIQAAEKAQDGGDGSGGSDTGGGGTSRNTIDSDTLAQITAALTSTGSLTEFHLIVAL